MAESRTVTAIYVTEPFLVALDRSRGDTPRSAYLAGLVENDVDEPGVYNEPTKQVHRSNAAKRLTLSLRGEVVEKARVRRGDLPLATYAASVILTALDKLDRELAFQDHCRHQEEEAERQRAAEAARQPNAARSAPQVPTPTKSAARSAPKKKARVRKPKPRSKHQQPHPVGGHTRAEQRPRPRREIRLEEAPRATWERRLPPHLQEVEDRLQTERAQRQARPKRRPSTPASPASASHAVEKLAPPPSQSPSPSPSPSTHRGSQESLHSHEPFGPQEHPMNQIAPRRPPPGLGPRLIEKPQEALDHSDLLALLQRHEAGLEKHPVVVPVAALDGEGGRRVHQAMSAGLKGPGDALRVIVGVENETLETMPLIGPGVFDANWSRMTVLLKSLADRLGCNIEVTPYVVAVPLEEPDDEEADSWDETWGDEYDEQEDQAPEVPCGHVVLAYCLLKSAHGARGAFPSSSMW